MAVKNLKYALLYDVYGSLLSEKQSNALEMYYCEDLSLAEIAEHIGITRQGVRDQIKHAEEELENLESKLRLSEKINRLHNILDELKVQAEKCGCEEKLKTHIDNAISILES